MKNLLIGINSKYIHPNLAIRLLKANTTNPVDIVEFNIKDQPEAIINYIVKGNYDTVGFSCYIWNIELIKQILTAMKVQQKIIILGGPEVSYNAEYYLDNNLATYVIQNEGEESYHLLLEYLEGRTSLEKVPNLYHLKGYTFSKLVDLSQSKMAYDLLSDVKNQIIYFETSRGCPYHCGYCMASLDNKLRFFDLEEIKRQLKILMERGARVFKFLDRTFNAKKQNFIELIDFIIANHQTYNSFQFEITGELLDPEVIVYINEHAPHSLFRFEIGIQSTNVLANRAVYRMQNNEKLFSNICLIQSKNIIDLHLDLIAGLPYEDYISFQNTFNEVLSLRPKELQLGFLKLLKGTKLYEEASQYQYRWQDKAPYELIENQFLSANDIQKIHQCENAFEKFYNSKYFKHSINACLDLISNAYDFFYAMGEQFKPEHNANLEASFKFYDAFVKRYLPKDYLSLHQSIILDYLHCFKVKPLAWWEERITPKDKNQLLRDLVEQKQLSIPLNRLYKYALVIQLKTATLIAIYEPSQTQICVLNEKKKIS